MKKMQRILSMILLCVLLLSVLALSACGSETNHVLEAKNGVVCVVGLWHFVDYYGNYLGTDGGTGSGICVGNPDEPVKYVVTNRHVVDDVTYGMSKDIRVLVDGAEYKVKEGKCYFHDSVDLALLELDTPITNRTPMVLGDTNNVKETDKVFAIGFRDVDEVNDSLNIASSTNDMTVLDGTIVRKSTEFSYRWGGECVQTSVAISHGNSGGPLITEDGQVIAVNTWGTESGAVSASYSLNVRYVKDLLKNHGVPFMTESPRAVNMTLIIILIVLGALLLIGGIVAIILVSVNSKKKKAAQSQVQQNYVDPNYGVQNYGGQNYAGQIAGGQNYVGQIPGGQNGVQQWNNGYVQNDVVADLGVTEAAPPESGTIKVLAGSMRGAEIPIRDGETLWIGKDAKSCNVVFDPSFTHISRMHCSVTYNAQSDRYIVVDESTNGTYLENGTRLPKHERRPVTPGTTLRLAKDGNCVRLG